MNVRRTRSNFVVCCLTLPLALAGPLSGQADSGARVRVTTAQPKQRVVGTLVSLEADSLRITSAKDQQSVAFPTGSVVQLERSVGRRSQAGHGAVVGGVAVGGLGLLLALVASSENDSWLEIGPGEVFTITAAFGAVGAGVGALIGSASHTDRWEPIPVGGLNVQAAKPGRSILKLSLQF